MTSLRSLPHTNSWPNVGYRCILLYYLKHAHIIIEKTPTHVCTYTHSHRHIVSDGVGRGGGGGARGGRGASPVV